MHEPQMRKGTADMDATLETSPHYTDQRFKKPQTVFCSEPDKLKDDGFGNAIIEGCHYDYSDRIYEWDGDKAREAAKATTEAGYKPRTAKWYQAYLHYFYGKDVKLVHIVAGVNHSNGYPYCVYGTKGHNA
jgi:hypothetical protein